MWDSEELDIVNKNQEEGRPKVNDQSGDEGLHARYVGHLSRQFITELRIFVVYYLPPTSSGPAFRNVPNLKLQHGRRATHQVIKFMEPSSLPYFWFRLSLC
jgi:hypothetical protein